MDRKKRIQHEMNKLISVVLVLLLVDSTFVVFDGNFTGNVVKESEGVTYLIPQINEVDSIKELSSFNEGFYLVKEGYVFYVESAASYIPLYIKVNDIQQQNGMISIDEDGTMEFDGSYRYKGLAEEIPEVEENIVTGYVGIEEITGFATTSAAKSPIKPEDQARFDAIYNKYPTIPRGTFEGLYSAETSLGKNVVHSLPSDVDAGTTGPLGLSRGIYQNKKYNPNGQYDPNTLEGSLEISAVYLTDFMKSSNYDKNAPEEVRANQIQIAWNSGKVYPSGQIKQVLDSPKYAAAGMFNFNNNLDPAAKIGRFVNFMYGYAFGKKSETSSATQSNEAQIEVSQTKDSQENTVFLYSDGSKMTVKENGEVKIDYPNGKALVFENQVPATSSSIPTIPTAKSSAKTSTPSEQSQEFLVKDGIIYETASGYPVINKYGQPTIDIWGPNNKFLTTQQKESLRDSFPDEMGKLERVPYFVQDDGSRYYVRPDDKITRKEGDQFVTYKVKQDGTGWTYLQACTTSDGNCNGKAIKYDANNPDLTKCCDGNTPGFSVLETRDEPEYVTISQNVIEQKQPLPYWVDATSFGIPKTTFSQLSSNT